MRTTLRDAYLQDAATTRRAAPARLGRHYASNVRTMPSLDPRCLNSYRESRRVTLPTAFPDGQTIRYCKFLRFSGLGGWLQAEKGSYRLLNQR